MEAATYHVIYPVDKQQTQWKVKECVGREELSKWLIGNEGAQPVQFTVGSISGNSCYSTLADALAVAKNGDVIRPKVEKPLPTSGLAELYKIKTNQ